MRRGTDGDRHFSRGLWFGHDGSGVGLGGEGSGGEGLVSTHVGKGKNGWEFH